MTHPYLFKPSKPSSKIKKKLPYGFTHGFDTWFPSLRYLVDPRVYPRVLKRTEPTEIHGQETIPVRPDDTKTTKIKRTEPTEIHGQETIPVWPDDTTTTKNALKKRMHTVRN